MSKVAFLALTYDSFHHEDIMKRFFCAENHDLYNLYIHPKNDITGNYFDKYVIDKSLHIPTAWGYYSLVQATVILMKEALKDPENEKFVLISDSHIPCFNMVDTHRILHTHYPLMTFAVQNKRMALHRFYKAFDLKKYKPYELPILSHYASYVSQWFTCNRADADIFVAHEEKLRQYFVLDAPTYIDESYFVILANHFGLQWIEKVSCFAQWDWDTSYEMIQRGCKKNPHTFQHVTSDFINHQRDNNTLFIRKVHSSTIVDDEAIFSPQYK